MTIQPGIHKLGPDNSTLLVCTERTGAAAKAGHDLVIHVTSWQATLELDEDSAASAIELQADATSLRVREGSGGLQALSDNDKTNIEKTIDDEVLKRKSIEFRSTGVQSAEETGRVSVQGELELGGNVRPISFDLAISDDGKLTGSAIVKQSDWKVKPYSTLFGALKVADAVRVVIEASLPAA